MATTIVIVGSWVLASILVCVAWFLVRRSVAKSWEKEFNRPLDYIEQLRRLGHQ
jgi:hypothetical protein